MATKKTSENIDDAETKVNYRYSLGIMKQDGDSAGLAKAEKEHPTEYADWERRQAAIE